jgi:flagellar biogenesis protein FliO
MGSVGLLAQVGARMGLGAFVASVGAAAARRFRVCRSALADQRRALRVAETSFLGQNRAIHLITVGRRSLLVGSTPNSIALLADVSDEAVDRPETDPIAERRMPAPTPFAAVLSQLAAGAPHHVRQTDAVARLRSAAAAIRGPGAGGQN